VTIPTCRQLGLRLREVRVLPLDLMYALPGHAQ
jgi:hypothetical protein